MSKATEKRELKVFSLDRIYLDYLKVDTHVYVRTSALGLRDAVKGQRDDLFEVVLYSVTRHHSGGVKTNAGRLFLMMGF